MFRTLDDLPWSELTHACGPATDVPDQLRALASTDTGERDAVLWELYGNLFHQGTRYPATPFAVPFLVELLAHDGVPEKADLLAYLVHLVAGYFSLAERPCMFDGVQLDAWGDHTSAEHLDRLDDDERAYLAVLSATWEAARSGVSVVLRLLGEGDVRTRASAAWLLACFRRDAHALGPVLQRRLLQEIDPVVRAAIAFALGELGFKESLRALWQQDPHPLVRRVSGLRLAGPDCGPELLAWLIDELGHPVPRYDELPMSGDGADSDLAAALGRLPKVQLREALSPLLRALDRTRSFALIPIVRAILGASFEQPWDGQRPLNPSELRALEALVAQPEVWRIGNLFGDLRVLGLPANREEVRRVLGA